MNLYLKHRPKSFQEMIGNKEIIESLEKMINKKDKPHSYLFTGPSGCGKTTAARICSDLIGAKDLSVMEINSSNNRGIDTARNIIEQMRMNPIDGNIWSFIMDEVHLMTTVAQNAMLKPLEDYSDIAYFFLCTTDPQKLIKPLKNRCTEFNFSSLSYKYICKLLRIMNRKEKIEIDKEIIEEIAEYSGGSPRRALVLFEKIIGMEKKKAIKLISQGIDENESQVIDLCRALLKDSWGDISDILKNMEITDPEKIRRVVLGYMNSVLLNGLNYKAGLALEYFSEPFYNSGMPGITLACYQVISSGGE